MSFIRNTALNAVATVTTTLGRLLMTTLIARRIGPEAFGVLIFAQWCAETIAAVATVGLPNVLARYCPELADAPATARRARVRQLFAAGAATFVIALVASAVVFGFFGHRGSYLIAASIAWTLGTLVLMLTNALGNGLLRFDLILFSNLVFVAVGLGATFLLVHPGDPLGAMLVWVLASLTGAGAMLLGLRVGRSGPAAGAARPLSGFRDIGRYAVNTWIGGLAASQLWTRGEIGVLRVFEPPADIARYGAATTLSGLIMQGVNLFQGGLTPHLAKAWAQDDRAYIESLLGGLSRLTFAASIGGGLLIVLFAPQIVSGFFGARFAGAAPALMIIVFGVSAAGAGPAGMAVQFATDGRFQRNVNLLGVGLLVGLTAGLAPFLGIAGAALARTLVIGGAGIASVVMLGRIGYPDLRRTILWRWALGLALLAGCAAAAVWLRPGLVVRAGLFCLAGVATLALFAEPRWLAIARAWPAMGARFAPPRRRDDAPSRAWGDV
ncbi:MAG TPA: oligosaccharide flippase family protein [Caulobacteraceae bacterium]|jgi:O-antigen/teichoic acid export membrane protein|nr:oligosaccharide flippase family protein [Caulobacteraceae bacterium]